MANRNKQLELVKRITHERAMGAQRVVVSSQQALNKSRAQMEQLIAYRNEYNARFLASGGSGISASQLAEFRRFLSRIDEAINAQEKVIEENSASCTMHRANWLKIQSREQALENLVQQRTADEVQWLEQIEQKLSDERAQIKAAKSTQ